MTEQTILIILSCAAAVHYVMTAVMALFARHRIQYLAISWAMGIFAVGLTVLTPMQNISHGSPGIMHPFMLMALVGISFMQSFYTLSIPMPAYLQMWRMIRYARPAIIIYFIYLGSFFAGSEPVVIRNLSDLQSNLLSSDMLLRVACLGLSCYYIVNIFRLPRRLAQHASVPRYLLAYCTVLGLSALYYVFVSVYYRPELIMSYIIVFTLLNLYLCFRTLESVAIELPKPVIAEVQEAPSEEAVEKAEREDFNEANLQRFQRVQFWMQGHPEQWMDNTFNRDRLCEEVGINRHLVLQCLRSQGYNNVHDYINYYRINKLKQMIDRGDVTTITECMDAGFGTIKTVRSCFLRMEGSSVDDYLAQRGNSRSK